MKYTIQSNKNLIEFGEINIGELFIDEGVPFIKILEVSGDDIYNCTRLDNGILWYYHCYELVKRPKNYNLKIEM